ncbi:MAG TPA: dUTP diphosphatase [Selenomonadales bacterium]|nr:dUTP diphosphatase [Selenomonadales bacterium]
MRIRGFEKIKAYEHADFPLPERKTAHSAGYDITAAEAVVLAPQAVTLIPTGLKAYMQEDEYLGVHIRSGLAVKHSLGLINGQGIIDADYYNNPANEGHILIAVFNYGREAVAIGKGERVAQGIFYRYLRTDSDAGAALPARTGGIGSTGTK